MGSLQLPTGVDLMQIEMSKLQAEIVKALLDNQALTIDSKIASEDLTYEQRMEMNSAVTGSKLMKELSRQIGKKLEACK
jgi:DNA-directed RNA polymerase specialized sigma54-like protein